MKRSAPVSTPSDPRAQPRAVGEVRIIGGLWKRTRIPVADRPGLRPTPDRVRETLFNWLGQDLTGWTCVDVFAGTGALGLEAASRGAARVHVVESDRAQVAQIRALQQRLSATALEVTCGDGLQVLARLPAACVDLVFLDPPFDANLFDKALVASARVLKPDGWLYLEAPTAWDDAALQPLGYNVTRHLKAGAVHAHLLKRLTA